MAECCHCEYDVCISNKCSTKYQMSNNTYLTVCHICKEKIESKFEMISDFSDMISITKEKPNNVYNQSCTKE